MRWNVGTKLAAGFGATLLILTIVGYSSLQATQRSNEAATLRGHTYSVIIKLAEALSLIKDLQTSQRGFLLTGDENYLTPFNQAQPLLKTTMADLRKLFEDHAGQRSRLDRLDVLISERLDLAEQVIAARRTSGLEAAIQEMKAHSGEANMDKTRSLLGEIQDEEEIRLEERIKKAAEDAERAHWTIIGGTLAAFAVAAVAAILLAQNIAWPLRALTNTAEKIALGELTVTAPASGRSDEVGQLGNAFAAMVENLRDQIRGLVDGTSVLAASASEIVASTSQLAASASESAAAVSETTATVEEVRQTAEVANQKAKTVSDTAQKAALTCNAGRKSAEDAIEGMNRIRQQTGAIAETMVRLSEQGQAIGQIIATVEDLSSQSNLLAVNAAIEAAKAGEHGKGFSVVAQEVKSLAEQSRQATNQIRTILGDIQKATTAAVMATEQGNRAVEAGEKQTEVTADSIVALSGSVSESAQAATQIAASSQQQLVGMDQVAMAMENIKQASTQNVASAKQLEAAARGLSDLGARLKLMIARYKV